MLSKLSALIGVSLKMSCALLVEVALVFAAFEAVPVASSVIVRVWSMRGWIPFAVISDKYIWL